MATVRTSITVGSDTTYANFRKRIHSIAADMRAAYEETDAEKSISAWRDILGDKFSPPEPAKSSGNRSAKSVAATVGAVTASRSSRQGRAG